MQAQQKVFKRAEKKYIISQAQFAVLMEKLNHFIRPDLYPMTSIYSLYYDTPEHILLRRSIDKPVYKEKIRLRSYGCPGPDTQVFVEMKKKFKKTVYKRRVSMTYSDALEFLSTGNIPDNADSQLQIMNEIAWSLQFYQTLEPFLLITYNRYAYRGINDPDLRITFDYDLQWSDYQSSDTDKLPCHSILPDNHLVMEIKIPGAMPLWLSHILAQERIYPTSFSKVGTAYKHKLSKGEIKYA